MNSRFNYVFICSAGHSGSTLLDLLLGSHSKITSLGEIIQLPKNISLNTRCTCGQAVRSCPFWRQVVGLLNKDLGIDIFKNPYALHMGYANPQVVKDRIHNSWTYHVERRLLKGLRYVELRYGLPFSQKLLKPIYTGIENTFKVYDAVREVTHSDLIVDSSKSYLEAVGVYVSSPSKVRILLLTRDGRGVFHSYLKRNFSRSMSLHGWKNHYGRAVPLLRKHVKPEHLQRVRYEDLVGDTSAELRRLCEFLQVDFEADMLRFAEHVHHITNGNDMRFSQSSEIRCDDAWRHRLMPADLAYFEKVAGDLNRRLGYE
jgi:hypothetical protein